MDKQIHIHYESIKIFKNPNFFFCVKLKLYIYISFISKKKRFLISFSLSSFHH